MGRGLGPKQQEMLGWLQQQWADDIQPDREQLMGAFVMDKPGRFEWNRDKARELQRQYQSEGMKPFDARLKAEQEARNHPDGPELTPRPVAEAYRRALRTLVDRDLVKVVVDPRNFYRYTDPNADDPLRTVNDYGKRYQSVTSIRECGRSRDPKVSRSEQNRQALLKVLPADGSWVGINDALDAFWLQIGGEQSAIDEARAFIAAKPRADYPLQSFNAYRWLRLALVQLQKAGKAEAGTIPWNSSEIVPKQAKHEKVVAMRVSVASRLSG